MIINAGEYVHIIHRQFFQSDAQRHFVGTVEGHEGNLIRVKGYLFAMDSSHSQFVRREQLRTRIVALNDAVIVNVLPSHVEIDQITYTGPARRGDEKNGAKEIISHRASLSSERFEHHRCRRRMPASRRNFKLSIRKREVILRSGAPKLTQWT